MISSGFTGLVARCAVAALLVAACGNGPSGGSITTTRGGAIGYGVLSCFTGILAPLGRAMLQGAQVAQTAVDAGGGILGKQLTVSYADTGCNETDAVPAVNQLLQSDHVVGIIGPETQEIAAISPIVTQAKIPTEFQGGSTLFDRNGNQYLWRDSPSDSQLGVAMALYAKKRGDDAGALVFYSDIAAQTFLQPITQTFQKLGGQIVANVTVAPDQPSYRAQMQQVVAAHPQVVFTQTDAATAATMLQDLGQLGASTLPLVGTDVTSSGEYLQAITYQVAHDHLVSVYGATVTGPASDAFESTFAGRFGATSTPLANANYAYDAVISLALAMDQAGTTDGTAAVRAMNRVTNPPGQECFTYPSCLASIKAGRKVNYQGASGDLDYDRYNNVFGLYGAFRASRTGNEEQVALISADELAKATP